MHYYEYYSYLFTNLIVGTLIRFNGRRCRISTVDPYTYQQYYHRVRIKGEQRCWNVTIGAKGFLVDIDTGQEFRANWENLQPQEILVVPRFHGFKVPHGVNLKTGTRSHVR